MIISLRKNGQEESRRLNLRRLRSSRDACKTRESDVRGRGVTIVNHCAVVNSVNGEIVL